MHPAARPQTGRRRRPAATSSPVCRTVLRPGKPVTHPALPVLTVSVANASSFSQGTLCVKTESEAGIEAPEVGEAAGESASSSLQCP